MIVGFSINVQYCLEPDNPTPYCEMYYFSVEDFKKTPYYLEFKDIFNESDFDKGINKWFLGPYSNGVYAKIHNWCDKDSECNFLGYGCLSYRMFSNPDDIEEYNRYYMDKIHGTAFDLTNLRKESCNANGK